MTAELVTYDAACTALAACVRVDQAKSIRDKAEAMRVYARQANNRKLEIDAAQIRLRAERRLGQLIVLQKETVGLNRGTAGAGRPALGRTSQRLDDRPTLADVGISHKLSMRAQWMARLSDSVFDQRIASLRACAAAGGRIPISLIEHSARRGGNAGLLQKFLIGDRSIGDMTIREIRRAAALLQAVADHAQVEGDALVADTLSEDTLQRIINENRGDA